MPTHHRTIKVRDWEKRAQGEEVVDMREEDTRIRTQQSIREGDPFVVGPNGEKRPASSLASIAWAVQIATGQREEEYVDGRKTPPKKRVRIV